MTDQPMGVRKFFEIYQIGAILAYFFMTIIEGKVQRFKPPYAMQRVNM